MQFDASTFSDPAMRSYLQQYYDTKKAALIDSLQGRDSEPKEVTFKLPDGTEGKGTAIPMTAEFVEKALVSFDKWLELQADTFDSFGPDDLAEAERHMAMVKANNPDSSSDVRSTFSRDGTLLAYVTQGGGLATSNGAGWLQSIARQADELGLQGEQRVDYLNREIEKALSAKFTGVDVTTYDSGSSPTKREFAAAWQPGFDVDSHYADALAEAQSHLDNAQSWHNNWARNMNDIRSFLLSAQEAA